MECLKGKPGQKEPFFTTDFAVIFDRAGASNVINYNRTALWFGSGRRDFKWKICLKVTLLLSLFAFFFLPDR